MSYVALANITLGSSASSVTFSSLPTTGFRDLVLVIEAGNTATTGIGLRFNSDSGSNYSWVGMWGTGGGTTPTSNTTTINYATIGSSIWSDSSTRMIYNISLMDYSATDKHKTLLYRSNSMFSSTTEAGTSRWANTSAITSIQVFGLSSSQSVAGSTFALYGIRA